MTALEVAHKGGITYGYRISDGGATFAYLPDHATTEPGDPRLLENARRLAAGADVLVHDAQFVAGEEAVAPAYGPALVEDAVRLATEAGVQQLLLFHHGPNRTDEEVARLGADAVSERVAVSVATETTTLSL